MGELEKFMGRRVHVVTSYGKETDCLVVDCIPAEFNEDGDESIVVEIKYEKYLQEIYQNDIVSIEVIE